MRYLTLCLVLIPAQAFAYGTERQPGEDAYISVCSHVWNKLADAYPNYKIKKNPKLQPQMYDLGLKICQEHAEQRFKTYALVGYADGSQQVENMPKMKAPEFSGCNDGVTWYTYYNYQGATEDDIGKDFAHQQIKTRCSGYVK